MSCVNGIYCYVHAVVAAAAAAAVAKVSALASGVVKLHKLLVDFIFHNAEES